MSAIDFNLLEWCCTHWISLAVGSVVFVYYWFGVAPYSVLKKLGIPGPKPAAFFGNTAEVFADLDKMPQVQQKWYSAYGKVFGIYHFREPQMFIGDPEIIKQILVKEFQKFSARPVLLEQPERYSTMLTTSMGQKWKDVRTTLSPTFSSHKMKLMMSSIDKSVNTLLKKLGNAAKAEEVIDMYSWLQKLTMEIILATAFGAEAHSQTDENDKLTVLANKVLTRSPWLALLMLIPYGAKLNKYVPSNLDPFAEMVQGIIDQRNKGDKKRQDMIQLMLDSRREDGGKLEDRDIVGNAIEFLLAGYETSSTTMAFLCYHLALDSHVQDRAREEIEKVWPGNEDTISYDTLQKMEYLDMVISEGLRMYPPAFFLTRSCKESCTLNGVHFPKDMTLYITVYSMHRDPDIYPDPEKFDPLRFTEEEKQKRHPYTYLPFGQGPRGCIGMRFALLQIKLTLAKMLKHFQLELTDQTPVPLGFRIKGVLAPPDGKIMLKAVARR